MTSFKENNKDIDFDKEFPAFLVGNKCDLEHKIDDFEIDNLKNEHNFYGYADTSAKDGIGIDDVFSEMSELLVRIKGKKDQKQNVITIAQYLIMLLLFFFSIFNCGIITKSFEKFLLCLFKCCISPNEQLFGLTILFIFDLFEF